MTDALFPVVVEQVRPEVTYGVRAAVLRPGLAPMQARLPGDDAAAAQHFAAYALSDDPATDRIVGVVAVLPEPPPDPLPISAAEGFVWRLRGMAVEPDQRCRGVGRALLDRVLDAVGRAGGGLLWCNARSPAAGFYEGAGFVPTDQVWEDPEWGPHVRMFRQVTGRHDSPGH
jgi:GNAT superfamily N-acetyltransferase